MTENDPKLSRLYREASSEAPPAALDAAILAAARERIAKPERRKRSSWLNWMAPASAIATLVLGVSIALLIEREQPATTPGTTPGKILEQTAPGPAAPPAARETESPKAKAADSTAPAAAMKKEAPATPAPARAPAPAAQAPAPIAPAQAPPRAAEPRPPAAEAFPAERRAERGMAAPEAAQSKSAREQNAAGDAVPGAAAAGAPAAPAAAGKTAPLRQETILRSAKAWLEEISDLMRDGRDEEAARQLAEFRKAYPAHPVPEDLLR